MMDIRNSTTLWITTRFNTGLLAWGLVLLAGAMIFYGSNSYPRLVTVGVLYGLIAGGVIFIQYVTPSELDIRVIAQVVVTVFAVLFAFILGELAWSRAGSAPIDVALVLDVTPLAVNRFVKTGPIGLLLLLGYATEPAERIIAVPSIIIWVGFVWIMELLGSYQGFGWPILPVIFSLVWLILVLLSGVPLFVLGVALKQRDGEMVY